MFQRLVAVTSFTRLRHRDSSAVRDDFPVIGSNYTGLVLRLEVRLIKAWEDNMAVIRLQLRVDVLRLVSLIFKVLEALAVSDVISLKLDNTLVFANSLMLDRNIDAVVRPKVRRVLGKHLPINHDRAECLALVINEQGL